VTQFNNVIDKGIPGKNYSNILDKCHLEQEST